MKKLLLAAAMEQEIAPFLEMTGIKAGATGVVHGRDVVVCITGVGPVAAGYHIQEAIHRYQPGMVIQAGTAGCYPGSGLKVGETVIVVKERLADLGVVAAAGFNAPFNENLVLENNKLPYTGLPCVSGNTVSTACAPYIAAGDAQVESMEGYSLFYVCLKAGVRFVELRAVSNVVSDDYDKWNFPRAAENLAAALNDVIRLSSL